MSSYESLMAVLKKHMKGILQATEDHPQHVYETLFDWITDSKQSPESILYLLDTCLSGYDRFKYWCLQNLVAFTSLEALARRSPEVLEGPWEKVALIIVKYSKYSNDTLLKNCVSTKSMGRYCSFAKPESDPTTLKWIIEISSPQRCPNPCLRLELFRLMRGYGYNACEVEYDRKSHRDIIISTLHELNDKYSSFTVDQVPMCTAIDLADIIMDTSLSLEGVTLRDNPDMRYYIHNYSFPTNIGRITLKDNPEIIATVIKLTKMFALLEAERYQTVQVQPGSDREGRDHYGFMKQLIICLSFCGLIQTYKKGFNRYVPEFLKSIGNNPYLLDLVVDTSNAITCASNSLQNYTEGPYLKIFSKERDRLLHLFFRNCIRILPMHQYLRELHGGFTPVAELQLRLLFDNAHHDIIATYNDSKNVDPEEYYYTHEYYEKYGYKDDVCEGNNDEDENEEDDTVDEEDEEDEYEGGGYSVIGHDSDYENF